MTEREPLSGFDRRRFLQLLGAGVTVGSLPAIIAACGGTTAGTGTGAGSAGAPSATPIPAPGGTSLGSVPRAKTLVFGITGGNMTDYTFINPFLTGTSTSTGFPYYFEAPMYYNSYHTSTVSGPPNMKSSAGIIPWQIESYQLPSPYTSLQMKIRQGVTWSDGQPFTSADVAYTLNMLKSAAPKLTFSVDMATWVKSVETPDKQTAIVNLTTPNPRFMFDYFQFHQDIGIHIMPQHVWQGQDPTTFTFLDLAKGQPITTSPWQLVLSTPTQRIFDRRKDWWASKAGFHDMPDAERIIVLPGSDETNMVEFATANTTDETIDLRPVNIQTVLAKNTAITTWTGEKVPYGYRDWWPVSLGFNDSQAPFDDADIRWAINHTIRRDQLISIGYHGAGEKTMIPYPNFPALEKYLSVVKSLAATIDDYDLSKTNKTMQGKGYTKNSSGLWEKNGKTISMLIQSQILFTDITPVLVEQLRKGGFDASFDIPAGTTFTQKVFTGEMDAFLNGHGGSVEEPYDTLKLYHSRYSAPTGTQATQPYRWKNTQFDAIVDQMATVNPSDFSTLSSLFEKAMKIWVPALPDIGLVQWFHRIPTNSSFWTNWPDASNPFINTCYWHRTSPLWIYSIKSKAKK
ncbi:MAG: ABC transporter substrate-binding protein [Candidatus Dormiibacterota bacterium]